jgi:hypothetical protein
MGPSGIWGGRETFSSLQGSRFLGERTNNSSSQQHTSDAPQHAPSPAADEFVSGPTTPPPYSGPSAEFLAKQQSAPQPLAETNPFRALIAQQSAAPAPSLATAAEDAMALRRSLDPARSAIAARDANLSSRFDQAANAVALELSVAARSNNPTVRDNCLEKARAAILELTVSLELASDYLGAPEAARLRTALAKIEASCG